MPPEFNLKEKHGVVQSLWTAVNEGGGWLSQVPGAVRAVLQTEAWREREDGTRVYRHGSFREFIEAPPRSGCGWPLDKVEDLLKDDPDTLRLYRQAIVGGQGRRNDLTELRSNTTKSDKGGAKQDRGRAYALDRLSREAPTLYEAVCGGEMSANAAAIKAGFRKRPEPLEIACRQIPKLTTEELDQLIMAANEQRKRNR